MQINSSQTGIQAAQTRQDLSGHNLANVQTPDFHSSRALSSELKEGGTRISSIDKMPEAGVQIDEEMVQMIKNEKEQGFNAQALKTQDQMLGEIIDLKR